jgi:hypothetical protein
MSATRRVARLAVERAYSGFSGATKPRGQSARARKGPPVRFQVGGWGSSGCGQVRGMLGRAGQLAKRDGDDSPPGLIL